MLELKDKKQKPMAGEVLLTKERLEVEAYYRWLDRGCPENDALADWVEAEKRLGQTPWVAGEGDD